MNIYSETFYMISGKLNIKDFRNKNNENEMFIH